MRALSKRKAFLDSKKNHSAQKIMQTKRANTNKAYKLLSMQHNISCNKAKELIDRGLVSVNGARVRIAREEMPLHTRFCIIESKASVLYEDEDLLVLDKGIGIESYELEKRHPSCKLIHRLDMDTSGVILMSKNEDFRKRAIMEFKNCAVKKLYIALAQGRICDHIEIDSPISTSKGARAFSRIDSKHGKPALSIINPLRIIGNKTLVEIEIKTGLTHQIRVHLASIDHPIIGDTIYNNANRAKRMMLHCYKMRIFDKEFISKANIDKEFCIENA